jgi:UDP-N-acetylmuramoyl-tripeptide--D-alanyl-D-alanine ligase
MKLEDLYILYSKQTLVDTDTRNIREGSLFFALKGENFNGNMFAEEALNKGAKYAIIDEIKYRTHPNTILVDDVLKTLQELANFHRKQRNIPIIALTGSNGKTTTKELISAVIAKRFETVSTQGNLNNHIGVPLTLLSILPTTEFAVVEMGANHLKEIEFLCNIIEPNYGYITNFGKAHLEGFGSFEAIIKGKSELFDFLRKYQGKAFVNSDDKIQLNQSAGIDQISFDQESIKLIGVNPFVKVQFEQTDIKSNLIGEYNYTNIAAAICIGNYFKVPMIDIKSAIENYIPSNNRSQIIDKKNTKIILDAYNANPTSMEAALKNFEMIKGDRKIVFLGDMFELGQDSAAEHQKIAELATSFDFETVYLIGKAFSTTGVKNAFLYDSFESFKNSTNSIDLAHATILIKGSRGMALERILDLF